MRKDFGVQTWLYPMPVLIIATYNDDGTPNAMNAAWGGIHDTNQIAVCIDPSHKTAENLQKRKCFTVSAGDAAHVTACDYVGMVSGSKDPDKFAKAGFHALESAFVDAPLIAELPMTLECRLISYDAAAGCAVGEIVNVSADTAILNKEGKIDPALFEPIAFDPVNHTYIKMGGVIAQAFKEGLKLKQP